MGLNYGFLKPGETEILGRVQKWSELVSAVPEGDDFKWPAPTDVSEENQRIIIKDAERTFVGKKQREILIQVLTAAIHRFNDYQQGLGYVTSFLLLFLEEKTTLSILTRLNSSEKYIPNYWKHEAVGFATDAYVFEHLLQIHFPKVAAHLKAIWPETYCQKWFVGFSIHVLPFASLFPFFEQLFQKGYTFLFEFALSLVEHVEEELLKTPASDSPAIYAILRLDPKLPLVTQELAASIVEKAAAYEDKLKDVDYAKIRKGVYESKLKARLEAAKRSFAESDSDDESEEEAGEECQICNEKVPEMFCKTCQVLLCEECHDEEGGKHKKSHKISTDWEEINELTAAMEKLKA